MGRKGDGIGHFSRMRFLFEWTQGGYLQVVEELTAIQMDDSDLVDHCLILIDVEFAHCRTFDGKPRSPQF